MYAEVLNLRSRAQDLDQLADGLAHEVGSIQWQGYAADAMRSRATRAVADLRRCGQLHRDAAVALERHHQAAVAHPVGQVVHAAHDLVDFTSAALGAIL